MIYIIYNIYIYPTSICSAWFLLVSFLFPHFPPQPVFPGFCRVLHHLDRHSLASFSVAFQGKQRAHLTHQHLWNRGFFFDVYSPKHQFFEIPWFLGNKINSEMIYSKSGPSYTDLIYISVECLGNTLRYTTAETSPTLPTLSVSG